MMKELNISNRHLGSNSYCNIVQEDCDKCSFCANSKFKRVRPMTGENLATGRAD